MLRFNILASLFLLSPLLTITQSDIDQANSELDTTLAQIDEIDNQMSDIKEEKLIIQEDITSINEEITQTETNIANLEYEASQKQIEIDHQTDISLQMLMAFQKIQDTNFILNQVFSDNEETNFISRIQNVKSLVDITLDEINETIVLKEDLDLKLSEVESEKQNLTNSQIALNTSLADLEAKDTKLSSLQSESYAYADELKASIADMEVELAFQNANAYVPNDDKEALMSAVGIAESDFFYVDYIISRESSWNYTATNPYSGAYGLCQALPGSKMSSAGSDWETNPYTQMSWCNSYAISRYGSWSGAYNFWLNNNWW